LAFDIDCSLEVFHPIPGSEAEVVSVLFFSTQNEMIIRLILWIFYSFSRSLGPTKSQGKSVLLRKNLFFLIYLPEFPEHKRIGVLRARMVVKITY